MNDWFLDWYFPWVVALPLTLGNKQPYKIVRFLCALFIFPWMVVIALSAVIALPAFLVWAIKKYVTGGY